MCPVLLKRLFFSFFVPCLRRSFISTRASEPSAYAPQLSVTAGALASGFQPDYAGGFVAQAAPNRLYGPAFTWT